MYTILAINWASALTLVTFGFAMVFVILIALVALISVFGKLLAKKVVISKPANTSNEIEEDETFEDHLSADYSAAIALALHLAYSDVHDVESQIITIKKVERRYSPWSSKIYGINNLTK